MATKLPKLTKEEKKQIKAEAKYASLSAEANADLGDKWGVAAHGYNLLINPETVTLDDVVVVDFETDEKDNFVGCGLMCIQSKDVYYLTDLSRTLGLLQGKKIIAHSTKRAEAKWLAMWGFAVNPTDVLFYDTAIASYVLNPTRETHRLKELSKVLLGSNRPDYDAMTFRARGKSNLTLDKQPIERVANYCGMDVVEEKELYERFNLTMSKEQKWVFDHIEMPTAQLLYLSEQVGIKVDREHLEKLDRVYKGIQSTLYAKMRDMAGKEFNPASNKQTADILESFGFKLPTTKRGNKQVNKEVLQKFEGNEFVDTLLAYNQVEKLPSTFTGPLLEYSNNPQSRVHTTYNQVNKNDDGISTGRISCSDPINLQTIPSRSDLGKQIRESFIPDTGMCLSSIDLSQIEPRILTHVSQDPILLDVYLNNKDIYQTIADLAGEDRDFGKKFLLAVMYGVGDESLAEQTNKSVELIKFLREKIYSKLHYVAEWQKRTIHDAKRNGYVTNLFGWRIPLPAILDSRPWIREHGERQATNAPIQSSAAHMFKLGNLNIWRKYGLVPVLQVHDERLDEHLPDEAEQAVMAMCYELENAYHLSVPVIAEGGIGNNWHEGKDKKNKVKILQAA